MLREEYIEKKEGGGEEEDNGEKVYSQISIIHHALARARGRRRACRNFPWPASRSCPLARHDQSYSIKKNQKISARNLDVKNI